MARGLLVVAVAVSGTTCRIADLINVKDAALLKVVPVAPDSLKASSALGSAAPQVAPIEVINDGGGELRWRAFLKHSSPWVTLDPDTGTAGQTPTLRAIFHPSGLVLDEYEDTVVVQDRAGTGTLEVPLWYRVRPCDITTITLPDSDSSTLTSADCGAPHRSGRFARVYQINNGTSVDSVTVEVTASYDAYVIFDTALATTAPPLKQSDNCLGAGSDPCLYYVKLPRDGVPYFVEVTSADSADTGAFKVRVLRPRAPSAPDSLSQRVPADSTTPVIPGGVISQQSIVLRAVVSDPDLGDTLQLQAEVQPVGTNFTNFANWFSAKVPNDSPAYVLVTGLNDNTSYHWRVRAADQTGRVTTSWSTFADPAFNVQAGHAPTFQNQNQYQANGTTVIAVGADATSQTVVFKAQLNDVDPGDQLVLQVEAEPVGTAFDNNPSGVSAAVPTGATATVTLSGLTIDTDYHWQLRAVDNGGAGRSTAWTPFGNNPESAADFHISPPAQAVNWLVQPGTTTAGSPIAGPPQVAVQDLNGNTVTSFNGPVTMAITTRPLPGGQITLLGTTTVNAASGVATFPNLIIDTAGVGYKLTATATTPSGSISSVASLGFNITAAPVTQLVFTVQPTNAVAGAVIAPPIKVSAEDQFGNVNPSFTNSVAVVIANNPGNPPGTLGGTLSMAAVNGVATFSNLSINKTGVGYTLRASSGSLTPDTSAGFNITPGPATHLAFTVPPTGAAANQVFVPPVQVSGLDAFDNLATSFAGNVTVAIGTNPGSGTLFGTLTRLAGSGTATFNDLRIDKVGNGYTLVATTPVTGVATGTSPAFNITTSGPDSLTSTVVASPAAITACSTGCSVPSTASTITVTARDNGGNPVGSVNATITVTGNGNTFGPATKTTDVNGVATWTLNSTVASATPAELKVISAVINSVPVKQRDTVTVNPGPPAALEITNQVGNTTAGAAINSGSGVVVRARDQFTNTASFNGTVMMTIAAPAGGAFAPTSTNSATASSGIANFPNLRIYQAGTGYQLRASSGTLTPGLSNNFTINAGAPNKLAFTTQPTTTAVLARIDSAVGGVVVSVQDSVGNTVPFGGTVQVVIGTNPGGGTLTGGNAISAPTGVATFANLRINAVGTGYTLVTTSSGPSLISDQSNSFDIVTGPPAKLVFFQNPTNATAGATISPPVTVQIQDVNGFLTTSNASVTLAITTGTGTSGAHLSGGTQVTVAAVNGTATFSSLSIDSAGTNYRLTASSGTLTTATSNTFTISAGAANKLVFGQQPTGTTAGANISPPVTVRILDALGNQTTSGASVTLVITPGTGTTGANLSGGGALAAVNGVASFGALSIDSAGTGYTLRATSGALTQATSNTFNIAAGAATQLVFTKPPTNTTAGAIINQATGGVVVTARDAQGNTATGFTSNVTISIVNNAGPGGQLTGTTTRAAVAGVATFNDLRINKTGTGYTLGATDGGFNVTSAPFNVTPGTAAQLIITTQPSSSAQSGVALGTQPVVQVADAQGNPVAQNGTQITATIAVSPGGSPSLSNATATTNASGTATFSGLTIAGLVGDYRLRFAGGVLTPDTSTTITLSAGAATKLAITTAPSSSTQSGVPLATQPVLQVQDASGNPVSQGGTVVTATIASGPGGSSLANATATTNASGTATFSGLTITGPVGNYTLDFDDPTLAAATSGTITLTSGNATKLGITTQPSSSAQSGVAFTTQPAIQIQDASGNPVSQSGTVITATIASGPGGATLSNATATTNASGKATFSGLAINGLVGTYTLTFSGGGFTAATSNAINLSTGPATKLTITTQPSSSAQSGVGFGQQPVIQLRDAGGNAVSQSGVQVTATFASGPSGTLSNASANTNASGAASFSGLAITGPAGDYTLSFGSGSLTPVTSNTITLSAGSATKLGITTQPSSTAQAGVAFTTQPVIQVQDVSGNPVSQNGTLITATIASGPGGATLSNPTATTNSSGTATFSGLAINGLAGSYTLTFSGGGLTPVTSNTMTLSAGPATRLAFVVQPPASTVAGVAMSPAIQVVVQDAGGNTVGTPRQTITMTIGTNPAGGTLSGTLSVQTSGSTGISTFNNLSIDKAASGYTLVASSGTLTQATSNALAITPAGVSASQSTVSASPTTITACNSGCTTGSTTASLITVTAKDAFGNVIQGLTVSLNSTGSNPNFTTPTTTNSSGVSTSTFTSTTAESKTISATVNGVGITQTVGITVTPASAATLAFTSQPQSTSSGSTMSPVVLTAFDAFGNVASGFTGDVTMAITTGTPATGGPGALGGTTTIAASGGVATFSNLSITGLGTGYTLSATSVLPTVTSASFDIT
ncbi:MAG TPA: Ig-like domain-containing protein [Gemmatimonadales bacterium]|nr:Ig-like domain-containing protein [Gemmatimonadales bacterium]